MWLVFGFDYLLSDRRRTGIFAVCSGVCFVCLLFFVLVVVVGFLCVFVFVGLRFWL
jgi:hypothetical protein